MRIAVGLMVLATAGALCLDAVTSAQQANRNRTSRSGRQVYAKPPKWTAEVLNKFFPDARERLVGQPVIAANPGNPGQGTAPGSTTENPSGGNGASHAWSKIISRETIEDEVKRLAASVKEATANPGTFNTGGHRVCRDDFATLAVLFAVTAQYDGDVRWKKEAPALRDAAGHTSRNCKVSSTGAFQEAKQLAAQLEELVRGGAVDLAPKEGETEWTNVADFSPIMKRMEVALDKRLKGWVANAGDFSQNSQQVAHEAQMLAVMATIIKDESYGYTPDDEFEGFADEVAKQSGELLGAVTTKNYDAGRAAFGSILNTCTACHQVYR